MAVYFGRHGESKANLEAIFVGQRVDSPLTARGEHQAIVGALAFQKKNIKIDRIVSGPLCRATRTAELVADVLGLNVDDIIIDPRLTEYDSGILSGQPTRPISTREMIAIPEAEDIHEFQQRVLNCVKELRDLHGNTLIISHTGPGKIIEADKQGIDLYEFNEMQAYPNAEIVEI